MIEHAVAWFAAQRWRAALFHALLAAVLCVLMMPFYGVASAATAIIAGFYVREVTQWQYALKGVAPTWTVIHRGWWPGTWVTQPLTGGWYAVAEFLCPATVVSLIAAVLIYSP